MQSVPEVQIADQNKKMILVLFLISLFTCARCVFDFNELKSINYGIEIKPSPVSMPQVIFL